MSARDHGEGKNALHVALGEFHRSGMHPAGSGGAALIQANLRQVLQFAAGRGLGGQSVDAQLQRSAQSYVRRKLLHANSNHYELLGVHRSCGEAQVKEHYRLLMRLLHPDFADAALEAHWPADAAARINFAYETLGSPQKRQGYDRSLERAPATSHASGQPPWQAARRVPVAPPPHTEYPRSVLKLLAAGFGVAGALAGIAYLVATEQDAPTFLVRSIENKAPNADRIGGPTEAALAAWNVIAAPFISSPTPQPRPAKVLPASVPPVPGRGEVDSPSRAMAVEPRLDIAAAPPGPASPTLAATPAPPPPPPAPAPLEVAVAAAPPPRPVAVPVTDVTMMQAHPVIARLLAQAESGSGDKLLLVLEADARNAPSALSFAHYYAEVVGNARSVKVRNAQFSSEPRDGRLVVIGKLTLDVTDASATGTMSKQMAVEAEFTRRRGNVVMTRLARAGE